MNNGIIVYVSRTGHSRELATLLGQQTSFSIVEIKDLVNRSGIIGWLRSGSQAAKKMATPIEDPHADLNSVETVVLVQPIWASSVVPPLRTWLRAHREELALKKIALLVSFMGSPIDRLKTAFESEFFPLTAFDGVRSKTGAEEKQRQIEEFARKIVGEEK